QDIILDEVEQNCQAKFCSTHVTHGISRDHDELTKRGYKTHFSQMSSPDRQELVQNAVAFLADPKTQASPLAQRIQFLEAKGLNPQEIDTALKQATSNNSGPSYQQNYPPGYGAYHLGAPPSQRWDWRDYFITAIISGSFAYGAFALF
ncbi:hypothetical protein E4T56_gene13835, partial [Termitomyces sp. T112]